MDSLPHSEETAVDEYDFTGFKKEEINLGEEFIQTTIAECENPVIQSYESLGSKVLEFADEDTWAATGNFKSTIQKPSSININEYQDNLDYEKAIERELTEDPMLIKDEKPEGVLFIEDKNGKEKQEHIDKQERTKLQKQNKKQKKNKVKKRIGQQESYLVQDHNQTSEYNIKDQEKLFQEANGKIRNNLALNGGERFFDEAAVANIIKYAMKLPGVQKNLSESRRAILAKEKKIRAKRNRARKNLDQLEKELKEAETNTAEHDAKALIFTPESLYSNIRSYFNCFGECLIPLPEIPSTSQAFKAATTDCVASTSMRHPITKVSQITNKRIRPCSTEVSQRSEHDVDNNAPILIRDDPSTSKESHAPKSQIRIGNIKYETPANNLRSVKKTKLPLKRSLRNRNTNLTKSSSPNAPSLSISPAKLHCQVNQKEQLLGDRPKFLKVVIHKYNEKTEFQRQYTVKKEKLEAQPVNESDLPPFSNKPQAKYQPTVCGREGKEHKLALDDHANKMLMIPKREDV